MDFSFIENYNFISFLMLIEEHLYLVIDLNSRIARPVTDTIINKNNFHFASAHVHRN